MRLPVARDERVSRPMIDRREIQEDVYCDTPSCGIVVNHNKQEPNYIYCRCAMLFPPLLFDPLPNLKPSHIDTDSILYNQLD